MRKPPRITIFLAILLAVGIWVALDDGPEGPAPRALPDGPRAAPAATSDIQAELPQRLALQRSAKDPFSTQSWTPAPRAPAPSAAAPAALPVAPPLPYRYVGELVLPTGTQVFLARGDDTFRVSEGQTLDGEYRVQSLKSGEMVFVHLATGQQQTMKFSLPGEGSDALVRAAGGPPASPPPGSIAPVAATPAEARPAAPAATSDAATPARMRWEGPASARAGASFNVALRMTTGEQIRSAPMELRFDPKLLEAVSVRPGRYFGGNGAANFGYRINGEGSIYIGVSNASPSPASDAELLVLTFKPIKAGTSAELSVAALNLQGPAGRPIAYTALTAFKTTITP
jgi:hypothetical protein